MDWFVVFWLGLVAFLAFWQAAWSWDALKSGVATYYFHWEISRADNPFRFWMLFASRMAGFLMALLFLALGTRLFGE